MVQLQDMMPLTQDLKRMNKTRQKQYDIAYMRMAEAIAQLSYAVRNKVGCIIVSQNGQVISQGFNGTPTGYDNCCEDMECTCKWIHGCQYTVEPVADAQIEYCVKANNGTPCDKLKLTTKKEVLHAESNAISKCAKWISSTEGATLYVTLSPCFECAKMIIQAGIKRVVYKEKYRDTEGISFLKKNGVKVVQLCL